MAIQLSPAGSGHAAPLNLFETNAGQAAKMAAGAARQKPESGERPHQTLSGGVGEPLAGVTPATGPAKGQQLAGDVAARNEVATGSATGASGVHGYHTVMNGLANIQNGVAVLSGKSHG